MAGLAYPGKSSIHRELAAIDAFIDALNDSNLQMRVRDKEPKNLDHALHIVLLAEANTELKLNAAPDDPTTRGKKYSYKARGVQNANNGNHSSSNVSVDSVNNRCDKICEMIETMCKSNAKGDTATTAVGVSATRIATATSTTIANITCYKCGNLGYYLTTCPELSAGAKKFERRAQMRCYGCQGYGHMARICPKAVKKEEDPTPAENVRVVRGPETRQMREHPVYFNAYLGKRRVSFLVDTGCERSVTPKRLVGDARIEQAECRLFAANGTVINVLGEAAMDIRIGELVLPTRFVVSNNITESMLGVEWFSHEIY